MDVSPLIRDGPGTGFGFREISDAPVFSYRVAAVASFPPCLFLPGIITIPAYSINISHFVFELHLHFHWIVVRKITPPAIAYRAYSSKILRRRGWQRQITAKGTDETSTTKSISNGTLCRCHGYPQRRFVPSAARRCLILSQWLYHYDGSNLLFLQNRCIRYATRPKLRERSFEFFYFLHISPVIVAYLVRVYLEMYLRLDRPIS